MFTIETKIESFSLKIIINDINKVDKFDSIDSVNIIDKIDIYFASHLSIFLIYRYLSYL